MTIVRLMLVMVLMALACVGAIIENLHPGTMAQAQADMDISDIFWMGLLLVILLWRS